MSTMPRRLFLANPVIRRALLMLLLAGGLSAGWPVPGKAQPAVPEPVSLEPVKSRASIELVGSDGVAQTATFSEIESLGLHRVTTSTFWPADDGTYEGVLLSELLAKFGLDEARAIRISAADGFSQIMPREDWTRWPILLATRKDGRLMSRRNKGPFRIIYPRDSDPALADLSFRLRWVWLVKRIEPAPGT